MPKETVKWGRDFATVTVRPSDKQSGYTYELGAEEAQKGIQSDELKESDVEFSNKPRLDVLWQRPIDAMSLPVGEEPRGSVQILLGLNPTDMANRIRHIEQHPEDLESFSLIFTEPLTRYEINNLIRTLKRARDAAYGSDE